MVCDARALPTAEVSDSKLVDAQAIPALHYRYGSGRTARQSDKLLEDAI
jgi:hypothetical protein